MTLICTVPSFKFTRIEEDWPNYAWPALLMRHGPPPDGVKWYGDEGRMHLRSTEAKEYVAKVTADIRGSIDQSGFMSHYTDRYVQMYALKMKNDYLRWWREWSRDR